MKQENGLDNPLLPQSYVDRQITKLKQEEELKKIQAAKFEKDQQKLRYYFQMEIATPFQ